VGGFWEGGGGGCIGSCNWGLPTRRFLFSIFKFLFTALSATSVQEYAEVGFPNLYFHGAQKRLHPALDRRRKKFVTFLSLCRESYGYYPVMQ